jgi:hypothetical protein
MDINRSDCSDMSRKMSIDSVNIEKIMVDESPFSLHEFLFEETAPEGDNLLVDCLEHLGIISPVTVCQDKGGTFHLIDGRKRIAHAMERNMDSLAAVILPEVTPITEVISFIFANKRAVIEASMINRVAFVCFALSLRANETWVINELCITLGLKPHSDFLDECLRVHAMPHTMKRLCHEKKFSLKQILNLTYLPEDLLLQLISWKPRLHLSASLIDEIASNLRDYLRANNLTIHSFASERKVQEIINSELSPRIRTERLRHLIMRRRYPIMSEVNDRLAKTVEDLRLPDSSSLTWDKTLENRYVDFSIRIKKPEEWSRLLQRHPRAEIEKVLARILDEL